MKGPGYRYDVDVRRTWLCPACGNRLRSRGEATTRRCRCTDEGTWMKLVDENVRRTFPQRERIVIPEADSDPEELEENDLPRDTAQTSVDGAPAPDEPAVAPEIDTPQIEPDPIDPVEPEPAANIAEPVSPPEEQVESFEAPSSRRRRDKKRRRKKNRRRNNESPDETASGNVTQESASSAENPNPPAAEAPLTPPENPAPPDSSAGGGFGENVFD